MFRPGHAEVSTAPEARDPAREPSKATNSGVRMVAGGLGYGGLQDRRGRPARMPCSTRVRHACRSTSSKVEVGFRRHDPSPARRAPRARVEEMDENDEERGGAAGGLRPTTTARPTPRYAVSTTGVTGREPHSFPSNTGTTGHDEGLVVSPPTPHSAVVFGNPEGRAPHRGRRRRLQRFGLREHRYSNTAYR